MKKSKTSLCCSLLLVLIATGCVTQQANLNIPIVEKSTQYQSGICLASDVPYLTGANNSAPPAGLAKKIAATSAAPPTKDEVIIKTLSDSKVTALPLE